MRRELHRGLVLGLLLLGGCDFYYDKVPSPDDLMKLVPWFDHMIKSPAIHPYQSAAVPRNTPPGSVPINRTEADWQSAWSGGNFAVADGIKNPTADPASTLAVGDTLFQIFCAVCHGSAGGANGPVGPRVGAPSLLTDKARALSDGHIYSVIRYGRGVMPRYGDKIVAAAQRWAIVNYVRKLQSDGGTAATPGGAH
jgi:mono/diheme cytochrome c family protein